MKQSWQAGSPDATRALAILDRVCADTGRTGTAALLDRLVSRRVRHVEPGGRAPRPVGGDRPDLRGGQPEGRRHVEGDPVLVLPRRRGHGRPRAGVADMIDALRKAGARRYTEYPGVGHRCWDLAYGTSELLSSSSGTRKSNRVQPTIPRKRITDEPGARRRTAGRTTSSGHGTGCAWPRRRLDTTRGSTWTAATASDRPPRAAPRPRVPCGRPEDWIHQPGDLERVQRRYADLGSRLQPNGPRCRAGLLHLSVEKEWSAPRIEPEVVVKLRGVGAGRRPRGGRTRLVRRVGRDRVRGRGYTLPELAVHGRSESVADFGVHAALVVGAPWPVGSVDPRHLTASLASLKVVLRGGQNFVAEGEGRNALGNPLLATATWPGFWQPSHGHRPSRPGRSSPPGRLPPCRTSAPANPTRVGIAGVPLGTLELELGS